VLFLEITDWVDAVEEQQLPLMKKPVQVLVVNIALHGSVVDLQSGQVLSAGSVTASSPRSEIVVDGHGDLNMQIKVSEEAADKFLGLLSADGVLQWEPQEPSQE
ncbi:MAG TPA: hypothetical protein PKH07_07265, partial [bacterium]|nr:hypothetical protein [bacterium]